MAKDYYAQLEKLDSENIFDVIDAEPNQLRQNYADSMRDNLMADEGQGIDNVVFVGMGGSALAGDIAKNWLENRTSVPFGVVRGSRLPGYITNRSLVILASYSGNTQETLLAFVQAQRLNARIITLSNGGKLSELSHKASTDHIDLPEISQPRLAVFSALKALSCILEDLGLVESVDIRRELLDTADFLDTTKLQWGTDKQKTNVAKDIARAVQAQPILIFTSPLLQSAGYKFKIDINENAKQMAFSNTFSELNHNEMEGWLFPKEKNMASVILRSSFDSPEVDARIDLTKDILRSNGFAPLEIESAGQNHIQQLLYTVLLGDYISAYLAILNGVDPTPVALIEEFKKKLSLQA